MLQMVRLRFLSRSSRVKPKVVFILGSGRSGTTWLAETINHDESYRYIYEPLHPDNRLPDCPFDELAPIPQETETESYRRFFDQIVKGKVKGSPADRFTTTRYTRKKLIKCIRANLASKWLHDNYPKSKLLFLIRNPMAVVASKAREDWGWQEQFDKLLAQETPLKFFTRAQQDFMTSKELTVEEKYFAAWGIENLLPLRLFAPKDRIKLVFYEDFLIDPQASLQELTGYLRDKYNPVMLDKMRLSSRTTTRNRGNDRLRYLTDWRDSLNPTAQERLKKAAKLFQTEGLYPDGIRPDKAAFKKLVEIA